MSDRDAFRAEQQERRRVGKAKQQEKRLERAVRKAVAEEIAVRFETMALSEDLPQEWPHVLSWAAGVVREIGSRDPA